MSGVRGIVARLFGWGDRVAPVAAPTEQVDARVLLINLDRDRERLERATSFLATQSLAWKRMPGLLGSALPDVVRASIKGGAVVGPGTLGCFLSHLHAWELVASGTEGAIILEDDVRIQRDLGECYETARASGLELLFMNNRMAPPKGSKAGNGQEILSIETAVLSRVGEKGHGCGGDGYFITPSGARSAIDLVTRFGVWEEPDWFLLFAATGLSGIPALADNEIYARALSRAAKYYEVPDPILKGAALRRPAVRHGGMGSTRLELNRDAS